MPEQNDIQQKIEARMAELPQDVQDAINASDLDDKVRAIGQKLNLHIDQIGALGDEVLLVMLGFTPLEGFVGALTGELHLDPALAQSVAQEVNTQIFLAIRESMQKFAAARAAGTPPADLKPAASASAPAAASAAMVPPAPTVIGPTTQVVAKPAAAPLSPELHEAEKVMAAPTVQTAPTPAPPAAPAAEAKPAAYQSDPYREPIE